MSQVKQFFFRKIKSFYFFLNPTITLRSAFKNLTSSPGFVAVFKIEAVAQKCFVKKVFLEISQIHRKATVPESLF